MTFNYSKLVKDAKVQKMARKMPRFWVILSSGWCEEFSKDVESNMYECRKGNKYSKQEREEVMKVIDIVNNG